MTASKGQKQVTWSRFSDLAFPFTSCRSRAQCITMSFSLKSIFSIKKCDCKSAGLEFSQFFSRKCLYFTLRIIFAAYRILHSHFSFWFLCVFINISHCFSLLCFCWESMFSVMCHFPPLPDSGCLKDFPFGFLQFDYGCFSLYLSCFWFAGLLGFTSWSFFINLGKF